jgi:PAS domain S-box-containing protein
MTLDTQTLAVAAAAVASLLGLLQLGTLPGRRFFPGVGRWTLGNLCVAVSLILAGALAVESDWAMIVVGAGFALASTVLFLGGTREFCGLPARLGVSFMVEAAVLCGVTFFSYGAPNAAARAFLNCGFLGIFLLLTAATLLGKAPAPCRRSARFTATVFALFGLVSLCRSIQTLGLWLKGGSLNVFGGGGLNSIFFMTLFLGIIAWSFGFFLLTGDRLVAQIKETQEHMAFLASIVESSDDSIIGTDLDGQILSWNRASEKLFGYTAAKAIGNHIALLATPELKDACFKTLAKMRLGERIERFEGVRVKNDGTLIDVSVILGAVRDASGRIQGISANYRDLADRKRREGERENLEVQLRHALKLESIGQLAAGIAHEINTPAQYIGDNTRFLKDAFRDLEGVYRLHQGLLAIVDQNELTREAADNVRTLARSVDDNYLLAEIPQAIEQTLEGINRVTTLVAAMKEFSHPGTREKTPTDLNRNIANTITVARNEWKYVATMETEYDPALQLIPCLPGDFNQVILNLIVNAAHAIADVVKNGELGRIIVRTRQCEHWVEAEVQDTGGGIPEHARDHIFEPFFTTKDVGRGTGQGLTIARSVVVDKHGGTIQFVTETGKGTTFTIRLPLDGEPLHS